MSTTASYGYPTPFGSAAAAASTSAAEHAFIAHYELDNQAAREQLWTLRGLLEQKEAKASHHGQLLSAAMQAGDVIQGEILELMRRHPQFAGRLWQAGLQPAPLALQPPMMPSVPSVEAVEGVVPSTPSRTILSLQHVTPGPRVGAWAPQPLGPSTALETAFGSPLPSPTSVAGHQLASAAVTPRRMLLPSFAPPAHPAPGSLPEHSGSEPPARDAAMTPPPASKGQNSASLQPGPCPEVPALPEISTKAS